MKNSGASSFKAFVVVMHTYVLYDAQTETSFLVT